jgi:hypothetical protein
MAKSIKAVMAVLLLEERDMAKLPQGGLNLYKRVMIETVFVNLMS